MAKAYRLISSDGHLEVLPERWTPRVSKQCQDRVPRTVRLPDGGDGLLIEGLPLQTANFLDLRAGWAEEYLGFKPLKQLPSEYVRDHIYFSVQYERVAVETR